MGQRLADAAVRGTTSATLSDEKRSLLDAGDIEGLMALNKATFGGWTMMADDDSDDDHDDTDDDNDGDDEDDEEDDEAEDKGKKPDAKDLRIKDLSAEAKKYRLRASQRGKRLAELEAELESLKKGKPKAKAKDDEDDTDGDDSSAEIAQAKKQAEELARTNEDLLIRLEFMGSTKHKWKNPKAALRLLDLSDVEITEDGEVEGLDEAIEALAKSDPYLLDKGKDDDDDDEDPETKRRKRSTGQPTGSRKKGNPNRDALVKKYPALRR